MSAYLIYLCEGVNDRAELEVYSKFKALEGDKKVEGVVLAEFPTWEEAEAWYDSPGYSAIRHHRMSGAKYVGLLVDGGVAPDSERMPQTKSRK